VVLRQHPLMNFFSLHQANRSQDILPKKPNYNFEKHRKELNRQAKKDAKREEKLRRKQQEELQRPPEPSPEMK
jgi:hypothetical protein